MGNFLIPQCHRQTFPVMERRIGDFDRAEPALLIGYNNVAQLTAPRFSDGNRDRISGKSQLVCLLCRRDFLRNAVKLFKQISMGDSALLDQM